MRLPYARPADTLPNLATVHQPRLVDYTRLIAARILKIQIPHQSVVAV